MRLRVILPLAALLVLSACGDDGPNETGSTDNTNQPAKTTPANPAAPSRPAGPPAQ
jgi:predicted small lipoprotein YifL